ncbi:MAG: hypothetical protein ACFFDV_07920 [Candidatus Thorarchaeota archaeon]
MKRSIIQPESNWLYTTQVMELGTTGNFDFFSATCLDIVKGFFLIDSTQREMQPGAEAGRRAIFAYALCQEVI